MLQFYQSVRTVTALVFLCRCMFKNIFLLFEFFCEEKNKNLYQTARYPARNGKIALDENAFREYDMNARYWYAELKTD